ncbi:PRTRC system protein E [Mucilaginibacter lacusdianchii]|uniref:PRTRC system protein E n=1 Tax=Mucilaginibacter lacusdianchii TaxID=2684211 RepID=UPI00131DA6C9|nr:PRTRC system protein E [Mucilaginibacter sp. JXJ CY 39]
MNFFKQIAGLKAPGTFKLAITLTETGSLVVSAMFTAACGDKAASRIIPLTLSGTAEELDEAFFAQITQPARQVAGLLSNMEGHLKSVAEAKAASRMEQDKKAAAKTAAPIGDTDHEMPDAKAERKRAYEQAMKTIAELKAACKYHEGLALLPSEAEHPDKAAELRKLRAELETGREQLNKIRLF